MTTDSTVLSEVLRKPGWYGRKMESAAKVNLIEQAVLDERAGRQYVLVLSEVVHDFGPPEVFVVPLVLNAGAVSDGRVDGEFNRVLLNIIQQRRSIAIARGKIEGERAGDSAILDTIPPTAGFRALTVEQTNTSTVIGDKVILKTLRKVEQGLNPEWEIEHFLQRQGFRGTPTLLGALKVHGALELTVALAHEFLDTRVDGWGHALESLRGSGRPEPSFLKRVRRLGVRIAELHQALGSDATDPAFSPEALQSEDLQRWSSSIIGELGVTIQMAAKAFPGLAKIRDQLVDRASSLAHLEPSGQKIRVHGDLHLGQVLSYRDDWMIFDFEGEPGRSYSQRREKHSPLKDVAGMLRSFSYAQTVSRGSHDPAVTREIHQAFLEGYRSILEGSPLLPSSERTLTGLLDALQLEKLLYELRYEITHRPDWVHIPAQALMEMGTAS